MRDHQAPSRPTTPVVRIFISSPSDVEEERELARRVVRSLQERYAGQLQIVPVLWEDLPLDASMSFQDGIDVVVSGRERIDIAVFLLWSRLGTPLGMQRPEGGTYLSGTERELDLMLAASRVSDIGRPRILAYVRNDPAGFQERLRGKATAEMREMVDQKSLVESFIQERFTHPDSGANAGAYSLYDRPFTFAQRFRVHLQGLLDALVDVEPGLVLWEGSPFRGLEAFGCDHAAIFNGRESEVADVVVGLARRAEAGCAALVLAGASGAGKSSLVLAGVIPSLAESHLVARGVRWRFAMLQPGTAGPDPIRRLAAALLAERALGVADDRLLEDELAEALARGGDAALRLVLRPRIESFDEEAAATRLLVFVDQLEELVTRPGADPGQVERFLAALHCLATSGRISVLMTIRSDFYAQLQEFPDFVALKQGDGLYDLLLPTPSALHRMITRPAMLAGLRFEEDPSTGRSVASTILDDAIGHPEALPLLQFALRELFERRSPDGLLTFAAYREIEGVAGALSRRAEQVLADQGDDGRAALDAVLSELVTIEEDDGATAVRRQADLTALRRHAGAQRLVEAFTAERLLIASAGPGGAPVVEVVHEALLRSWSRAAEWVEANREFLAARARIQRDLDLWLSEGRHDDYLIAQGKPLEDARDVLAQRGERLSVEQAEFVRRSTSHHRTREQRRVRRAWFAACTGLVLAVGAAIGGVFAMLLNRELGEQLYENRIAVAERELTMDHDVDLASDLLESCPETLRGWEWHYLMGRRDDRRPVVLRQPRGLWSVDFHPDGERIVTASVDGTARIWDLDTRREVLNFEEHNEVMGVSMKRLRWLSDADITVKCASFAPNGELVASGSIAPRMGALRESPGEIKLWNPRTGEVVRSFQEHVGIVLSLCFSPDGTRIASSSMDDEHTFKVWNAATGEVERVLRGHAGHVYQLCFDERGERLLSAGIDGSIKVWDARTLELRRSIDAHPAPVMDVAFEPGGQRFASAGQDGTVRIWDAASGERLHELRGHQGSALSVAYHPDGSRLASSGFDKTVRLWDPRSGRPKLTLRAHADSVWDVAFSPDGRRLVSASYDDTAIVWDAGVRPGQERPGAFVLTGHADRVNCVEFSPRRDRLATSSWDNDIRIWDARTGELRRVLEGHSAPVWGLAFDAEGSRLASAGWDLSVRLWDLETGAMLRVFDDNNATVQDVALSGDGRLLAASSWDGLVTVWDTGTGERLRRIDVSLFPVLGIDLSADGTRLATVSGDRNLQVWDFPSGELLFSVKAHQANVYGVAFSPDGSRIGTSGWDGVACVWDARTDRALPPAKRLVATFEGHADFEGNADRVFGIDFSPDGRLVATGGGDKAVRIWEAESGAPRGEPLFHRGVVWAVCFDPEGERVATASWTADGWVRTWHVE